MITRPIIRFAAYATTVSTLTAFSCISFIRRGQERNQRAQEAYHALSPDEQQVYLNALRKNAQGMPFYFELGDKLAFTSTQASLAAQELNVLFVGL